MRIIVVVVTTLAKTRTSNLVFNNFANEKQQVGREERSRSYAGVR